MLTLESRCDQERVFSENNEENESNRGQIIESSSADNESSRPKRQSVSLSFCSSLTQNLSDEEWTLFKQRVLTHFPIFKRLNGASGSQSKTIPFFIQPHLDSKWTQDQLVHVLKEMTQTLQIHPTPSEHE